MDNREKEKYRFILARENKILKSGIRKIFTPHQPIRSIDLFFGRKNEVRRIIEYLGTPGQHTILYGERGVGKSSLANITTQILTKDILHCKRYVKRCDSQDTFLTIIDKPLRASGIDPDLMQSTSSHKSGVGGGVNIGVVKADLKRDTNHTETYKSSFFTPSCVAEIISNVRGLLYIDEIDVLANPNDRFLLAELMKQLSDSGSNFKILVVGIAYTARDLISGHPSVQRCLKETRLGRMDEGELRSIIEKGSSLSGLRFTDRVIEHIIGLSAGYPHFTHLLALKCAEEAILQSRNIIYMQDLESAMSNVVQDAEGTLCMQYHDAIRSSSTDMYSKILLAASLVSQTEFSAADIRNKLAIVTRQDTAQYKLNNYLPRLVSEKDDKILSRLSRGVYRFTDPRMPSFIKIVNGWLD